MEKKAIIDFWKKWSKLSYLRPIWRKTRFNAKCDKWKCELAMDQYDGKIFGIEINAIEARKRDQKEKEKEQEKRIEALKWKEEIVMNLECQIWNSCADLDINLQCIGWMKTFWFDCLAKWILEQSTCPNWRKELTRDNIRPNKEWKRFINILETEPEKPLWEVHQKEWKLYWTEWFSYIWCKWMNNKTHLDHNIVYNEDLYKEILMKAKNELVENESVIKWLQESKKKEEIQKELNSKIFNKAIVSIDNQLFGAKNQLKKDFVNHSKLNIDLLRSGSNELNLIEGTIKRYQDTNDWNLIYKISKTLISNKDLRNGSKKYLENPHEISQRYDFLVYEEPISYIFSFWASTLKENKDFTISLDGNPNVDIVVLKETEEKYTSIGAKIKGDTEFKWYAKLELDINSFWYLRNNQINYIYSDDEPENFSSLKLKVAKNELSEKSKLNFKLYLFKINNKIETAISKTQEYLFGLINQRITQNKASSDKKLNKNDKKLNKIEVKKCNDDWENFQPQKFFVDLNVDRIRQVKNN